MPFLYNTMRLPWDASKPMVGTQTYDELRRVTLDQQVSDFYVEQRQALYRHLLFIGVMDGEAQELVQEAFLALYRTLRAGTDVENWRAWLFHAARNLALNRRKAAGAGALADLTEEIQAGSADPEAQAIVSQRRDRLFHAIAALSPQQRECLQLRAEGFGYREIAGILGVTSSTVGEFLQRGIAKLRKAGL